jgi:hypothetical protein
MTHPSPSNLALYAGQDLGWFAGRRTERHLAGCPECRREVEAFAAARDGLTDLGELPAIPWHRLAAEMKANIRLGLAAGECVRDGRAMPLAWLSGPRAMAAFACVAVLVVAGSFLQRPTPPVPTAPVAAAAEGTVLRATANSIELNQDGQTLILMHVRDGQDVTYSAGAQGSMRARYVDSETGNVTINNVYVQ